MLKKNDEKIKRIAVCNSLSFSAVCNVLLQVCIIPVCTASDKKILS